ncbi:MAG: Trk system potassium transporter TrkA [Haloarculaceae archaeon]
MRVVIVGAGEVGSNIAESLADDHEVVVIDVDEERVEALTYDLDVLAVQGDGADLSTLDEAGVSDADMLIASTDDDETNIVTCGTVKTVSDAFTIARVKNTKYLDTWDRSEGALGVDFMVGTNLLAAETIVRVIGLPAAHQVDTFAHGRVQVAEFPLAEDSPIDGQTVQQADRWPELTFAAVLRNDHVAIPTGETVLESGDAVIVIGSPESVQEFADEVDPDADGARNVLVIGGSSIGYHVARLLTDRGLKPRLVESDPERARELAESLPGTTVLEHDATDGEFLEREHVAETDVAVPTLGTDEKSLLAGLLAKRLGADRAVTVVENGAYVDLFEAVGIDVAVNPREAVAEEITRFTREQHAENVAVIASDRAEVLEIEVDGDSVLAGRPIRESVGDLPDGVVVGAITRDDGYVQPRGDTTIEVGDHVVLFMDGDVITEATELV